MYAYIAYRVGHVQDTEDLTAETFLQVVTSLRSFQYRGPGSFTAWLFRIAYHRVADYYRAQRGDRWIALEDLAEVSSDGLTPEGMIEQGERFARVRQLIRTLSPRRQEIVTLKFYGGLRNQEIAEVLGLDERTIAAHLSRALADLEIRTPHYADS
ncbi:MAG: sigma-70 family RNA polymerase sigma factor [Anaerolineae bacterium]|nr:sigma-70 family RNA polymerase sigma factor [Anaerolineae bacterium]